MAGDHRVSGLVQLEFDYRVALDHRANPAQQANTALTTIDEQLKKIEKEIQSKRPDILKSDWDFTIQDGQLKVEGAMTAEDKKWIDGKLNGDRVLVSAVEGYIKAAKGFLETSENNPAYQTNNLYSGHIMSYNFKNVEKQLEGKIEFKTLSEASWGSSRNPTTGKHDSPSPYRGYRSLEMLATQLTAYFGAT